MGVNLRSNRGYSPYLDIGIVVRWFMRISGTVDGALADHILIAPSFVIKETENRLVRARAAGEY